MTLAPYTLTVGNTYTVTVVVSSNDVSNVASTTVTVVAASPIAAIRGGMHVYITF